MLTLLATCINKPSYHSCQKSTTLQSMPKYYQDINFSAALDGSARLRVPGHFPGTSIHCALRVADGSLLFMHDAARKTVYILAVTGPQDTGDTRETPAIDVCKGLTADNAKLVIYDPKVTEAQIHLDLATPKFEWDHPQSSGTKSPRSSAITVVGDAYTARFSLYSRF